MVAPDFSLYLLILKWNRHQTNLSFSSKLLSFPFLSPPAHALYYCQAICTIWSLSVS